MSPWEVARQLGFTYLPHNHFEKEDDRIFIREQIKKQAPSAAARELGERFASLIRGGTLPSLSLQFVSDLVGWGAFLEEELPEGSFAGEYTGIVRQNDIRRYLPNDYLYTYPVKDPSGIPFVIDATSGNLTRFINHSFTPNLQPLQAYLDGFYHIIFLSLRKISAGEQLSYNYGQNYWHLRNWPQTI